MSVIAFQAKVNLVAASQPNPATEPNNWLCDLTISDYEGVVTGVGVQVGDVVAFDTGAYEPGTFTFYQILSIPSAGYSEFTAILEYMSVNNNTYGSPPLGDYIVGLDGTIARPSPQHGLLPVVSRDVQLISDRFTEYVQNYNFITVVDNLAAGERTFSKLNGEPDPLLKGMAVYITEADPQYCNLAFAITHSRSLVAGLVADAMVPVGALGSISSKGMLEKLATDWDMLTGDTGGLRGGKDYFIRADVPGGITSTPPLAEGTFLVKIGKAISATVIDINIEPPIEL